MNLPPVISVLVRTAGRELIFLERALLALRDQSILPQEIVLLNAGGDRVAVDKLARSLDFSSQILTVHHHPHLGQAAAANRALQVARGEWITFLDDDDTWEPTFIARVATILVREKAATDFGGVVTQTIAVHERARGGEIREERREAFNPGLLAIDLAALAVENKFTNNALVFRRSVVTAVGNFREDLAALYDWEFNVRLAARFRLEVVPEMLARYHLRPVEDSAPNTRRMDMIRAGVQIRNEWIRADIAAGRIGLGQLTLAGEGVGLGRTLSRLERWRSRIAGWFRLRR